MVLHTKPIAFSTAVVAFFALSIVGTVGGLSPDTCCKRALLGAVATYVAAALAVGAINAILTQAMIESQVNEDNTGDDKH